MAIEQTLNSMGIEVKMPNIFDWVNYISLGFIDFSVSHKMIKSKKICKMNCGGHDMEILEE